MSILPQFFTSEVLRVWSAKSAAPARALAPVGPHRRFELPRINDSPLIPPFLRDPQKHSAARSSTAHLTSPIFYADTPGGEICHERDALNAGFATHSAGVRMFEHADGEGG